MIRNVVVGRLRPAGSVGASSADLAQLREGLRGIAHLQLPGLLDTRVGLDAGLRAGAWSFAITNDWVDEDAYAAYDADPEHNVFRAMIVEVCVDVARVQFSA